jgi:hypothetical protein
MPKCSSWVLSSVFAATFIGLASAQTREPPDQGAAANVRQSEQYEQMLRSNPGFRAKRMQLECGTITDPQLRDSCVASFQNYGPTPPLTKR